MLKAAGEVQSESPESSAAAGGKRSVREKFSALKASLAGMESVLIAFSGGVDSTFLLKAAFDELGPHRTAALTATSPTYPEKEFKEAGRLAKRIGARHIVIDSNELEIPDFSENNTRRCYYCKSELFSRAAGVAKEQGLRFVLDGSNADDMGDYRPGREAAAELGVRSPLQETGLTKDEIRFLSRELGLSTWDKPSLACLSSRFPYGTKITLDGLSKVERGEEVLRALGFIQFRVRYHDANTVRLELAPSDIGAFFETGLREKVVCAFKELGFVYVTLDLEGYRTGSMNEVIGRTDGG